MRRDVKAGDSLLILDAEHVLGVIGFRQQEFGALST
jgi:hypothetical protein